MKRIIFTILLSSLSAFVFGQSITLDPRTTQVAGVQVASDLAFRKQKRETVNGGWTNYPRDNSSVLIFEGGGSLNGIADGQDGVIVYVFNGYPTGATTGQLLLQHENTTSLATNRILTPDGLDFPVGNGGVALIYDGTKQRWRVATPAQTGGPTFSSWGLNGNGGTNPTTNFIGTTDAQGFTVKTNNLERISIESGGDVGIGITTADSKLHVAKGSAGTVTSFVNTIGTFENNTHGYLSILTPATSEGAIIFGSPTDNIRGFVLFNHLFDRLSFGSGGNAKMTIESNGDVGIGTLSPTEKLHVIGNGIITGNVGIGTTSPTEKLHVIGNGIITGNVGIGTTTPDAKLEVAGTYAVSGKTTFTGTQHNYNLGGKSVIHVNGGASLLTGIAGGSDGMIVHIYVGINTDLTIADQSTSSLAANRIVTGHSGDMTILSGGGATLIYDGDVSSWRVIGWKP